MKINEIEEFTRDWDWFAVDPEGRIAHFTTAGQRALPRSVKQDQEAALKLIDYFFQETPRGAPYTVRAEAEGGAGRWADDQARSLYLKDFVAMASAGLFSYNADISGATKNYFQVAFPKEPLYIDQLPSFIYGLVGRTRSPFLFSESAYIFEIDTHNW
ncbi:MAG TPA: hypothetical protein VKZ53_19260 [Candidatus Angelobacter sp.]|nr:hypothetical protein [Candidatus Angelobacter sp.]